MAIEFNPEGGKKVGGLGGSSGKPVIKRQGVAPDKAALSNALSDPDAVIEGFFNGRGVSTDLLRAALHAKGHQPVEGQIEFDSYELTEKLLRGEISHEEYTRILADSVVDIDTTEPENIEE